MTRLWVLSDLHLEAARYTEREQHQLVGLISTLRKQDEQRNWLLWARREIARRYQMRSALHAK